MYSNSEIFICTLIMDSIRIAHIINPVKVSIDSDLYEAQPVTFKTMLKAKRYSDYPESINQYVVGYDEDKEVYPKGFIQLPSLVHSILNYNTFNKQRKLPLIADILNSLKGVDADYIIYTNVDIAVMPYFYDYVLSKIKAGSDSFIINRRVVSSLKDDVLMYAELGDSHPGYDCFVFKKHLLDKFILGNTCIGANWIGRAMYTNLLAFSTTLEVIKDAHLTFHIGEDGAWLTNDYSEFDEYNKKEVYSVISKLLEVTHDEIKIQELNDVLNFMDNWGKKSVEPIIKISLKKRIKQRIKKIVHAFYK